MAKAPRVNIDALCRQTIADIKNGIFKPVYLLMGDEPFYPEMVCDAIIDNCLQDYEKDFNETICYGPDVDADAVITAARRFPMMADRQLVVVKEAQSMKTLEELAIYCENPLDSTVLVILMHGAAADKRKSLYKTVSKTGLVIDSAALRDFEMPGWISSFYSSRGLKITPDAAALFAEAVGTDLGKVSVETDKLLRNLPEGVDTVTADDIEKNVGISKQFSIFELTNALGAGNAPKALRIAGHLGSAARFAMPMATAPLFNYFYKILKYEAALMQTPSMGSDVKAKILGVPPMFFRDYDNAAARYPMRKCMNVISLIKEYDFKGKGGEVGEATPAELIVELTAKILNV